MSSSVNLEPCLWEDNLFGQEVKLLVPNPEEMIQPLCWALASDKVGIINNTQFSKSSSYREHIRQASAASNTRSCSANSSSLCLCSLLLSPRVPCRGFLLLNSILRDPSLHQAIMSQWLIPGSKSPSIHLQTLWCVLFMCDLSSWTIWSRVISSRLQVQNFKNSIQIH